MSAIWGLVYHDGRPVEQAELERMRQPLAALGPNGGGLWLDGPVGLGQGQMCFTPEDQWERQPLLSNDDQLVLVADARIDNRAALTEALAIPPAEAQTLPDSAFILRAYQRWGEACVSRLIGLWAFALWDRHKRMLFAACSPFVDRPLFYYQHPHLFAFATMPRGLLALPDVPCVLNERAIAHFLIGEPLADMSYYRDIARLPAGHLLVLDEHGVHVRMYWQPELGRELRLGQDSEYVEAMRELLEQVVHAQMRSSTPVGIHLSGGLDSATLAAIAAPQLAAQGERFHAYTEVPRVGFVGPVPAHQYADETGRVQALQALYPNLELNFIRTEGRMFLDGLEAIFDHIEVPIASASNWLWVEESLRQAQADGQRVLLGGYGGNLTISWTGEAVLPELIRRGRWRQAWREAAARAQQHPGRRASHVLLGRGCLPLLPPALYVPLAWLGGRPVNQAAAAWSSNSPIHPAFAAAHQLNARAPLGVYPPSSAVESRRLRYQALLWTVGAAELAAGMRSLYGVDIRAPLWDVRVVEFCLALPEELYQRNGVPRWLIRQTMQGRLPPEIIEGHQRGLQAADWLERMSTARDRIASELDRLGADVQAARVLDLRRLKRLVQDWPSAGGDDATTLGLYRGAVEQGLMMGRFLRWFAQRS